MRAVEVAQNASDAGIALRDVPTILGRHKRLTLGVPLVLTSIALVYAVLATPGYTSTAQVYVDPRERQLPRDAPVVSSVPGDRLLLVESQIKIITSDEVLWRVIEKARLYDDPEFNGERVGPLGRIKALFAARTIDRRLTTLRNLRQKTAAKRIDRSFVIDVMATADTPERSATIANALADAYFEERADADASFHRRASEAIGARLDAMRNAVRDAEDAVAAYKEQNNLVGSRSRLVSEQQLDDANTLLGNARARLSDAQAKVAQIEAARRNGAQIATLPEAVQSPMIVQLRARRRRCARRGVARAAGWPVPSGLDRGARPEAGNSGGDRRGACAHRPVVAQRRRAREGKRQDPRRKSHPVRAAQSDQRQGDSGLARTPAQSRDQPFRL